MKKVSTSATGLNELIKNAIGRTPPLLPRDLLTAAWQGPSLYVTLWE
jgi:hypothetical protein